jgi:hypothetical protein
MGVKQRIETILPSFRKAGCMPRMDPPSGNDKRMVVRQRGNRVPVMRRGGAAAKARDPGATGGGQRGGAARGQARILNVCVGVEHGVWEASGRYRVAKGGKNVVQVSGFSS